VILDRLVEIKAPFNPGSAVGEVVAVLEEFGLSSISGDRYAATWVSTEFQKHAIRYLHSALDRSAIYIACATAQCWPGSTSGQCEAGEPACSFAAAHQ
jgi:hypothetical protein